MRPFSFIFESKKTILGFLILSSLVFTTFQVTNDSFKLKRISSLESGIQTCFTRVNQTYTAKLLTDETSGYLTQNFQGLTEECFAESISSLEENFKGDVNSIAKKLSTLASNVHWFHEDLIGNSEVLESENNNINQRFEKIETVKDELLEEVEAFKSSITQELNVFKNSFYVLATLLVVTMILEFISAAKRRISNSAREIEAERELTDQGGVQSVKIGEIIKIALEQNDLKNCATLFSNFYQHVSTNRVSTLKNTTKEVLVSPARFKNSEIEVNNNEIDKIWNTEDRFVYADSAPTESVNLENVVSKTVTLLKEKAFSRGVKVDVQLKENLQIKGKEEPVSQVVYSLLSFAMSSATAIGSEKSVVIQGLKLGDITTLDLQFSGEGFSTEILGKNQTTKLPVDLQICQSLINDIDGRMQIDNKIDQKGMVVGFRVKMIMKSAKNAKLVSIHSGSKKDIQKMLNNELLF
jgi:hypothetical protein